MLALNSEYYVFVFCFCPVEVDQLSEPAGQLEVEVPDGGALAPSCCYSNLRTSTRSTIQTGIAELPIDFAHS